jgi:uncharacterized membrane protein YesL
MKNHILLLHFLYLWAVAIMVLTITILFYLIILYVDFNIEFTCLLNLKFASNAVYYSDVGVRVFIF